MPTSKKKVKIKARRKWQMDPRTKVKENRKAYKREALKRETRKAANNGK